MEPTITFRCRYCHKACNNSLQLEKHERMHQAETVMTCRSCGEHFESNEILAGHSCAGPDRDGSTSCNFSGKVYASGAELQEHASEHFHGVEKFQCKLCSSQFEKIHDLQEHLDLHSNANKYIYTCTICNKEFGSQLSLECHLREHEVLTSGSHLSLGGMSNNDNDDNITEGVISSRLETFFCNICGDAFDLEGQFQQHLDEHFHGKLYECDICNSRFAGPFFLKHHMELHNAVRPYMCSQCGTGFKQKNMLMTHFKIHGVLKSDPLRESTENQPRQTNIFAKDQNDAVALIDKVVNQQVIYEDRNLVNIPQAVNGEGNESAFYTSQESTDGVTQPNPLDVELLSWTAVENENGQLHSKQIGQKSLPMFGGGKDKRLSLPTRKSARSVFPCDICNKVFKLKAHCLRHRRVHTGEMPYECGVCFRRFRWKSSLTIHACRKPQRDHSTATSNIPPDHSAMYQNDHQQGDSGECLPESNGHGDMTRNSSERFICSLCEGNFPTVTQLKTHVCLSDQWQNERGDHGRSSETVPNTLPSENSLPHSQISTARTDEMPHPVDNLAQPKEFQGFRRWAMFKRARPTRPSTPRLNTANTSYSGTLRARSKPFVCDFCSKVSHNKTHYLQHMRLHTGEKPFECDKCNRRFMWKSSLDSHKKSHRKKNAYIRIRRYSHERGSANAGSDDVISMSDFEKSLEENLEDSAWIPEDTDDGDTDRVLEHQQCEKSFNSECELKCHFSEHEAKVTKGKPYFTRSTSRTNSSIGHSSRAKDISQERNAKPKHQTNCLAREPNDTTSGFGSLSKKQNKKQIVCEYCNKVFRHQSKYLRHRPLHTGELRYQCDQCSRKFKWRSSLVSHTRSCHKMEIGGPFPLIYSEQSLELFQPDGIQERRGTTVGDEIFMCVMCGMDFATEKQLQTHMSVHEDTKRFPVSVPQTNTSVEQLSTVRKTTQTTSEISKVIEKSNVERATKSNTKNFVCEICSKAFGSKCRYLRHKLVHTGETPFQCDLCGKAFKWRSSLSVHRKSHNRRERPSSSSDYVSLIANELTQEPSEMMIRHNQHEKSASTSLKPYVCPQCGMDYDSDLQLQIHMYIHGDEAPVQRQRHTECRMDGNDCKETDGLILHMVEQSSADDSLRAHESQSRDDQSKESCTSGSSSSHKQMKRVCDICDKEFTSVNHYLRHMRIHTGEMPFECKRCNRKFKWRSSLDSHKKSHERKDALAGVKLSNSVYFINSGEGV